MKVVALDRLVPERGAAVLVDGQQIALFRVVDEGPDGPVDTVHAISHHDPFSGANVMARGILGSAGERITVASPLYKQVFDLTTGVCLADPAVRLAVWRTRIEEGYVHVDPEPVLDGLQDTTAVVAAVPG
ncbi:MAG: nitrite reductase small subunit NirD [Nocardioidaceae bacterium]